jgi:hypothetical protein
MNFKCTVEIDTLLAVEHALGSNLAWLDDALDLQIRQKDTDTIRRLKELNDAWVLVCRAIHAAMVPS